ncbi:translation initiation factor IF-2-like isoform X1 [Motacilla alba alba]|uniref:translation initiation factor IF-2-like isoform X1 n=1 Tax=Motacilla alba alba TaxID=1094192 RepID=UPI0018D56ECE|nr:translation initiation factor IF-2-like isoform X1 [Motacilla alba alba]
MYPARQECSASPPGPAAAAAPRPPAPHREPRGTHRGRASRGPQCLWEDAVVAPGGFPGARFPGRFPKLDPEQPKRWSEGIFPGPGGKQWGPTAALGLASSPSNKTAPKGAELPEIASPARNSPAVARQRPPDKVSPPSGSSWLPARWDPASRDGCPRCCRATLLLANQHQFFSGKLYVLLQ